MMLAGVASPRNLYACVATAKRKSMLGSEASVLTPEALNRPLDNQQFDISENFSLETGRGEETRTKEKTADRYVKLEKFSAERANFTT